MDSTVYSIKINLVEVECYYMQNIKITGYFNGGMWRGYQKLWNYFCLTVFVDSSLMQWFYFSMTT